MFTFIKKILIASAITALILPVSFADVFILKEHRIKNRGYGVCAWAAIETSARHMEIESLYNLALNRDLESRSLVRYQVQMIINGIVQTVTIEEPLRNNGGTISKMKKQCDKLKVPYKCQLEGSHKTNILYEATKENGPGAIIGLHQYTYIPSKTIVDESYEYQMPSIGVPCGYHAVLLTHIDEHIVKFVDSNDTSRTWLAPRKWFDKHWDGAAFVLMKPRN